jgi:DNA repair photolyase
MELRDPELFERKIYAKQFRPAVFRAELRRLKAGDTVWIGTATDPYQPAERRFNVTRGMLEAFADERGLDIGVTTKSDLVARDASLMARHQIGRGARRRIDGANRSQEQDSRAPDNHHAR